MTFYRNRLLGISDQAPSILYDLRQSGRQNGRAQQMIGEPSQTAERLHYDSEELVSKETEANVKMQIVEKYGTKLWEEKENTGFLEELGKDLRLLLEMRAPIAGHQLERVVQKLLHELVGWGPLDRLLADDDITEIMFHRFDHLVVERKSSGKLEAFEEKVFRDEDELLRLIEQIAASMGREFNETKAELNTQLPDGSRIAAAHRVISPDGHVMTIRKHRDLLTEDDYVRYGSICPPMLQFLKWAVGLGRASGIVSGGTGSGKTHLLNLISAFMPPHLSVITIEDVLELKLQHPFVRRFLAKPPNHEGKGGYSIRDCVRLSLRKRPDVIIVGESRGGEIVDLFWAMNTDHPGSWSTAHANSPRALIDSTLPILFAKSDEKYSSFERNLMIGSALQLIVQVKRFEEDGSRKVVAITEVVGTGESHEERIKRTCNVKQVVPDRVYLQDIFVYEPTDLVDGKVVGQYKWTGHKPERLVRSWLAKGLRHEDIDKVFFTTPIRM
ncbi:MAG: CpaF family protein [Clostridia bacterium]